MAAPAAAHVGAKREDKIARMREALQRVEEAHAGGLAEELGEALRKVDELSFAKLMRELRAEQQRRAGQERAGKKLAEAQALLQAAVARQDDDAVFHACVGFESSIAQCDDVGMRDDLQTQRTLLADVRGALTRRMSARLRLETASGDALGEEGRRQSLQEAVGEGRRVGLQDDDCDLRAARRDLEEEEALADLRRLVAYHVEHEVEDGASVEEFCTAIARARRARLPSKAPEAFLDATRAFHLLVARRKARRQAPSRRPGPGAAGGAPTPRRPRPAAPGAQLRKRPRPSAAPRAADGAQLPQTPWQPTGEAAETPWQPTGEAAEAAEDEEWERRHNDHGGDEERCEEPLERLFSWSLVDGKEALVFDFDRCDKKLLQYSAHAGQTVRSDFTKTNFNDITTHLKVSGTQSNRGEPDLLHRYIDFKIDERMLRASALGRRDQELRRRALGVAMCLAAAVHNHRFAAAVPFEFQRVAQHLQS